MHFPRDEIADELENYMAERGREIANRPAPETPEQRHQRIAEAFAAALAPHLDIPTDERH